LALEKLPLWVAAVQREAQQHAFSAALGYGRDEAVALAGSPVIAWQEQVADFTRRGGA
jgi:hypothetical protein